MTTKQKEAYYGAKHGVRALNEEGNGGYADLSAHYNTRDASETVDEWQRNMAARRGTTLAATN